LAGEAVIASQRQVFLGVERSLTGKRWEERLGDARLAMGLSQRLGLPEIVGRILAARGVAPEEAEGFMAPRLRDLLPDPFSLRDMDKAASRLADAVVVGESVAVFGDYDVDGATSSAVLQRFFRALGRELIVYIPDRLNEGYGPNVAALLGLKEKGVDVVVTVDCGITSFEPLTAAAEAGLEVIVVDHHMAEPRLPPATAVINPNRLDDESGLTTLAAVGVAFLLLVAVNRELRGRGWYETEGRREPDLRHWLDLVALGTVCDVVPLTGLNRAYVAQGLKVLAQRGNVGLSALADVAGVKERPDTYHAGFLLGPRINAGGRVGESSLGARLLALDDRGPAMEIARHLDELNAERRAIEAMVLDQAITRLGERDLGDAPLVFAAASGWHAGVIGIVASRLKDRYNRPAFVIALEEGQGKGSGRSVPGVDLGAAVTAARQAGLLVNGGGHPMAAGLTVTAEKLEELEAFLSAHIGRQLAAAAYSPSLGIDGAIEPGAATAALLRQVESCGPFGVGNAQPRFALAEARIDYADVVGSEHVRCRVTGLDGKRLKAIAFRAFDSPLGQALLEAKGRPLHLVGKLKWDSWAGPEAVQLIIDDAAHPDPGSAAQAGNP
jgi:single-stranded-DNA-specific exonuclease